MTRVFRVNSNNDIFAVNGRLQVASGRDAVLINCERAIKALAGEMIHATDRGVGYFEQVFNGSPNIVAFETAARAQLRRVQGVVRITSFSAEASNNELTYSATIITDFGQGQISEGVRNG